MSTSQVQTWVCSAEWTARSHAVNTCTAMSANVSQQKHAIRSNGLPQRMLPCIHLTLIAMCTTAVAPLQLHQCSCIMHDVCFRRVVKFRAHFGGKQQTVMLRACKRGRCTTSAVSVSNHPTRHMLLSRTIMRSILTPGRVHTATGFTA